MTAQLHEAYGVVRGRLHTAEDRALQRSAELARKKARRARREKRQG